MDNDMKRLLTIFLLVLFLLGCGIFKSGRSHGTRGVMELGGISDQQAKDIANEGSDTIKSMSGFTADDLYKSAEIIRTANQEKRRLFRRRKVLITEAEVSKGAIDEAKANDTDAKKIEIIQVVDEKGKVVAEKKVE